MLGEGVATTFDRADDEFGRNDGKGRRQHLCNGATSTTHNDTSRLLLRLHCALQLEPLLRQHVDLGRVVRWRGGHAVAVASRESAEVVFE